MWKKVQIASLVAGLAILVYLIDRTGVDALGRALAAVGWSFGAIIGLSAVRNSVRAGSWYFSLDPEHRRIRYWPLLNVMLAGESIKYLTASGPLLGEPAKAAMLKRRVPLLHGAASLVVENLIYNLSVIVFMIAGLPSLFWLTGLSAELIWAGSATAAVLAAGMAVFWLAMSRRWYPLSRIAGRFERLLPARNDSPIQSPSGEHGRRSADFLRQLEREVYAFYESRRSAFYLILGLNLCAHAINVIEVWLILAILGLPASVSAGFAIEAATKVINVAFFFVPARAGVYEGGNAFVLGALGMGAPAGVALAIIRKIRAFVWAGYGIIAVAVFTFADGADGEAGTSGQSSAR